MAQSVDKSWYEKNYSTRDFNGKKPSSELNEFLSSPLVTWFTSCLDDPNALTKYDDLVDGILLHDVFLQINPKPVRENVTPSKGNYVIRTENLESIVKNVKEFYEELGHIVITLPDTINLGREPESRVDDMKLLLLLILGCAVQCSRKEKFVTNIKNLDTETQHAIVDCIKQVTDRKDIVVAQDSIDFTNVEEVFVHMKKIVRQRDLYREKLKNAEFSKVNDTSVNPEVNKVEKNYSISKIVMDDNQRHYAIELADWKSKVRKQLREFEEKVEELCECKEELRHARALLSKLKEENIELTQQARTVKTYRDELDAVMQKAERADRLEIEITRYREKLEELEFYKIRIEELRQDNRILMDGRNLLEQELDSLRKRADKVLELQGEIFKQKELLDDMNLKREADIEKYQILFDENVELRELAKSVTKEVTVKFDTSDTDEADKTLSTQLRNDTQARALKLELEIRRLLKLIDSKSENSCYDVCERLKEKNKELKLSRDEVIEENVQLRNSLEDVRASFEERQKELQDHRLKFIELEKRYDVALREKERLKYLLEITEKRVEDDERTMVMAKKIIDESETVKAELTNVKILYKDIESRLETLEKEIESSQSEIERYRKTIEEKNVALDKAASMVEILEKNITQFQLDVENSNSQISRLQEIVRSSNFLDSRSAIDKKTLAMLQADLVAEKLRTRELQKALEKFRININAFSSHGTKEIFERFSGIPEIIKCVERTKISEYSWNFKKPSLEFQLFKTEQDITSFQSTIVRSVSDNFFKENAKLQVTVTTLRSKNSSLEEQLVNLKDSYSLEVAQNDELSRQFSVREQAYVQLAQGQVALRALHENLSSDYENILRERESLKGNLKNMKNRLRTLCQTNYGLKRKADILMEEKQILTNDVKNLNSMRQDHLRLQESRKHHVRTTDLLVNARYELNSKTEQRCQLELDMCKLSQRYELLLETHSGLERDRRSLMDHITLMLTQYHELLLHFLDDKKYYHAEEKMFRDMVNELYRQKAKLEDKIMDHYRRLENCSSKKKGFASSLVRKVKKAGSNLLNKNRRSVDQDAKEPLDGGKNKSELDGIDKHATADFHYLIDSPESNSYHVDFTKMTSPKSRKALDFTEKENPVSSISTPSKSSRETVAESRKDDEKNTVNKVVKLKRLSGPRKCTTSSKVSLANDKSRISDVTKTRNPEKGDSKI